MPTITGDPLLAKIQDFERFKRGQFARAGAALPGGLQAMRDGGSEALRQHVASVMYRPGSERTPTDKLALGELKAKLLKQMTDAKQAQVDASTDAMGTVASMMDDASIDKDILSSLVELYGVNQRDAEQLNRYKTEVEKLSMEAVQNAIMLGGGTGSTNAVLRSVNELRPMLGTTDGGIDGLRDPAFWDGLNNQLMGKSPTEQAGILSFISKQAGGDFFKAMQDAAGAGVPAAADVTGVFEATQAEISRISLDAQKYAEQRRDQIDSEFARGGGSAAMLIRDLKAIKEALGPNGDPAKFEDIVDNVIKGQLGIDPKAGPAEQQKYLDLLEQLDQPEERLPANLSEARRRLYSDPDFLAAMQKEGFTVPEQFHKFMKDRLKSRLHQNKMQDLRLKREKSLAQGTKKEGPSASSLAASTGGLGRTAEMGSAGSPGKTAPTLSPADLVEEGDTLEEVNDVLGISPPTPIGPDKAKVDVGPVPEAPANAVPRDPLAPGEPATPGPKREQGNLAPVTPRTATVPMMVEEARNAIMRPGHTFKSAEMLLREMLRKKPKPAGKLGDVEVDEDEIETEQVSGP